jgi:inner membrane protein
MLAFNHIAGGVALTSVVMSTQNVNIYANPYYLGLTIFASLLPDIDHPQSILGKLFFFLSKRISISYGHRTITHSIIFLGGISALLWWASPTIAPIFATAYSSHILFDLLTKQGVKLFYPLSNVVAVLPANPKFRLSAGDYKAEFVVFLAFIGIILSSSDLIAKGFSTYYNTTFKTFRHLHKENAKGKGVLEVEYKTGQSKAKALVISSTPTTMILSNQDSIFEVQKASTEVLSIKNTGLTPSISEATASKISHDSLVNLLRINKMILELEVNSNFDFVSFENGLQKTGRTLKLKNVVSPLILDMPGSKDISKEFKIKEIQAKIHQENQKKLQSEQEKASLISKLKDLESQTFTDYYDREKASKKIQELRKTIENFDLYIPDNQLLILELQTLQTPAESQTFDIYFKAWKTTF